MNIKTMTMLSLAAASTSLVAMPTKQDLDKVSPVVQDLMGPEQAAMKAGKKDRKEVAQAAIALAEQADSEAAKLLLLKGAFNLYVRDGAFDDAIATLKTLKEAIPDMPAQNMANIIESSLRSISRKNGGQLYRLLDETKTYVRYQNELKTDLAKLKKDSDNRTLHLKVAEKYAVLGNWTQALEEFSKGSDRKAADIATAERGEKSDITKKAIADFWWDYPTRKADEYQKAFKKHAAAIYEEAINSGDITGLTKVQAERRVEEAKEFGELPAQEGDLINLKIAKFRLAAGVDLELIKCPAGEFTMGYEGWDSWRHPLNRESRKLHTVTISKDYLLGKYPVTYRQWNSIMSPKVDVPNGNADTPVGNISVEDMKLYCDKLTKKFKSQIGGKVFRLPTEAEWEYASKAGKGLTGLFGVDGYRGCKIDFQSRWAEYSYGAEDHKRVSNASDSWAKRNALPIGKKKANEWGFFDIAGNVFEVTADMRNDTDLPGDWKGNEFANYFHPWPGVDKYADKEVDPIGAGSRYVVRGGCWMNANIMGTSMKVTVEPSTKLPTLGFRICIGHKIDRQKTETNVLDSKPDPKKYCVIDISKGPKASKYSVTYLPDVPKSGWTTADKTTKIVMRKVKAGVDPIGRYSLSKDYYVGIFEVTQKQWELVMGKNPAEFKGDFLPATMVSVEDVRGVHGGAAIGKNGFAGLLEKKTGLSGFDLPTEAQWEYASRAGASTKHIGGDSVESLDKTGWYNGNSGGRQKEVGTKLPNAWGIFDTNGNVCERCKDLGSAMRGVDPVGDMSGDRVANCGGQTKDGENQCAHTGRAGTNLVNAWGDRGFRIVLNLK